MSSILVLGGAGYIGSHTVYELIAVGENVVVVDNLETGFRKAVHQDAKFYQGDIRDKAFRDSWVRPEEPRHARHARYDCRNRRRAAR